MSLPRQHRQTIVILFVCLLAVLGAIYAVYGRSVKKNAPGDNAESVGFVDDQKNTSISTSTDWKKQFLQQGTSTIKAIGSVIGNVNPEEQTITGEFGKKFFERYAYIRQSNMTEDPKTIQALIDQTTEELVDSAPQARRYDLREIIISKSSSEGDERAYANSIGSILYSGMPKHDAATIALKALENEDPSGIKDVESIAKAYDSLLSNFLSTPVPQSLANQHVDLINGVSSMAFASRGMTKVFTDPLQSIVATAVYEKSLESFRNALLDMRFAFAQRGLTFSSSEPASVFNMVK